MQVLYNPPTFVRSTHLAADSTVFQDIADSMLPLFDNMPQVIVLVEENEWFHQDSYPLAIYACPNIVIRPSYARTCSYDEIQGVICHELIHAWLHWKGLEGAGEFLDRHHNELFVKKALEINEKKIDSLNVDVDRLLTTPKAIDIYNRVASIRFAPHLRHRVRRTTREAAELLQLFGLSKHDRFSSVALISFSVVLASSIVNKAHVVPDIVISFMWIAWAVGCLVSYALILIFQRDR
jgi:hypothetical protein